jgi:imidazolonepropionase-like amidohydrolase
MILEETIRNLCSEVVNAEDDEAVNQVLPQLRKAIHEYCENARRIAVSSLPKT